MGVVRVTLTGWLRRARTSFAGSCAHVPAHRHELRRDVGPGRADAGRVAGEPAGRDPAPPPLPLRPASRPQVRLGDAKGLVTDEHLVAGAQLPPAPVLG